MGGREGDVGEIENSGALGLLSMRFALQCLNLGTWFTARAVQLASAYWLLPDTPDVMSVYNSHILRHL
jgi:hypothetical protein